MRFGACCLIVGSIIALGFACSAGDTLVPTASETSPAASLENRTHGTQNCTTLPSRGDLSTIESGPFVFTIGLYSDPSLQPPAEADHPSRASDIPGVGWAATWIYDGPTTGPARQFLGLTTEWPSDPGASIPSVTDGQSDGRAAGGIVLPEGIESGDQLEFGVKVTIPEGSYGAVVSFRVMSEGDPPMACDVTTRVLESASAAWPQSPSEKRL